MVIRSKIERIIEKGKSDKDPNRKMISLGIPLDMIENIDQHVKNRPGMNRCAWILEAIREKLEK